MASVGSPQETWRLATVAQVIGAGERHVDDVGRDYRIVRSVAPAGCYARTAPLLLDAEEATEPTKRELAEYYAVLSQNYPERSALFLRNARVAGQGAVMACSGTLITESVAEFTARGLVPDGFVKLESDVYGAIKGVSRRIERPCLLAKRPWYRNYGHWLVDSATVIAMAAATGLSDGAAIVIGCYESPALERVVQDTVQEFSARSEVLVHPDDEVWEFDELCYVTPLHVPPMFKLPDALRMLKTGLLPARDASFCPTRRLFVSRGPNGLRQLLNEDELLEICVRHGFDVVYPERLSLADQAALFSDAGYVIGVKGAALTNAIFMSPGTTVIVLSPADFADPFFWDICGQADIGYVEIFGAVATARNAGHNDFRIDPHKLEAALSLVGANS